MLNGEDINHRPLPATTLISQKMGIHEWSYKNEVVLDERYAVPHRDNEVALADIKSEVELGFDAKLALAEAGRCLNCDVQTVFDAAALHRMRRLRRHLPDGLHHLHRRTAKRMICGSACGRLPPTSIRRSTLPTG